MENRDNRKNTHSEYIAGDIPVLKTVINDTRLKPYHTFTKILL